ncbi:MAG: DNA polymerase III subunit delta [Gemmatimonadales bacterium]|nr:DNA polymerase III subunit delta [Gemmatimonadales bacterium]MBA3553978.1 DNA polymerase III subunit delta [Gemmatimonadales bacterium]
MPAQTLDAFFRALAKGTPAPVYYFHGPEDILKDEAVRAILDRALEPALRDFNFDQRSAGQLDPESLFALCATLPMMAERRVVVLRDLEGLKRKPKVRSVLLAYLERPSPETVLILVQGSGDETVDKDFARTAYTVACNPLPPERVLRWLERRAESVGLRLEPAAAEHLVRSLGGELGILGSELAKLAALPAGEPLTAERVGELVGVRTGETSFDWRDALFDGRTAQAVRLLGPVLDQPGCSGVRLVTLAGTTLLGIGIARSHLDRRLRGRALGEAVFETIRRCRVFGLLSWTEERDRWVRWAGSWPSGRVRAGLRAALEADTALKGTTISDEHGVLTDMVLRMAPVKQEAA